MSSSKVVSILKNGGIAVIPTDTIYGIVTKASIRKAVARLYALRRETLVHHKDGAKPFIVLIDTIARLTDFGVVLTLPQKASLLRVWPGKVSVVLPCSSKKFAYLHLGTKTLAFRIPRSKPLQSLLKKTGPLLAPSANPEGEKPATTIAEAKNYFGTAVDVYISAGKKISGKPSTLVSLLSETPRILRQGAVKIRS